MINHTLISADTVYNRQSHFLNLAVSNNDVADAKLWTYNVKTKAYTHAVKFVGPLCNDEGSIIKYGMQLETEPMHNVVIVPKVTMRNTTNILLAPQLVLYNTSLTFGRTNWSVVQPIVVKSIQNDVDHNDIEFEISHAVKVRIQYLQEKQCKSQCLRLLQLRTMILQASISMQT